MSTIISDYATTVVAGDVQQLMTVLSNKVVIMPPGSNLPNEGIQKASMMLSAVSAVVTDFKFVRSYESSGNWYTVLLEGAIDGTAVQFIDQIHVDENNLVNHVDIFLRPASMAQTLLGKVTTEIQKRSSV